VLDTNKKKILIVEDNEEIAASFIACFEEAGFETFHTDNIDSAVEILHENEIDGVSLDIQLKGSLGINLIEKLQADELGLHYQPVVIVTSSFVGIDILRVLKKYRILHYDKSASGFNYSMVRDSFLLLLDSKRVDTTATESSDHLSNDDNIRMLIRDRLAIYDFNVKAIAYERLIEGIYYTITTGPSEKITLSTIYNDILNLDYHMVFVGMKRLLHCAFSEQPEIPTPADFIYQIVNDLKKDFPVCNS